MGVGNILISKADFARRCGVTRGAVNYALRSGAVVAVNGKVDTLDPVNVRYMEGRSSSSQEARRKEHGSKPQLPPPPEPVTDYKGEAVDNAPAVDSREKRDRLKERKLEIEILKKQAEYKEKIGELIPIPVVMHAFNRLGAVLDENMKSFDERNGAELYNMVKSNCSELEFCEKLSKHIDKTMRSVIRTVTKEVKNLHNQKSE